MGEGLWGNVVEGDVGEDGVVVVEVGVVVGR